MYSTSFDFQDFRLIVLFGLLANGEIEAIAAIHVRYDNRNS